MDEQEMDMAESPPLGGRSLDIEVGDQEVITIDLDALDPNPEDVLGVLHDAQCKVATWTQLANEYWKKGHLEAAQKICNSAREFFKRTGDTGSLAPVYLLLANIQIESSRSAPKMKLPNPKLDVHGDGLTKEIYLNEAAVLMNDAHKYAEHNQSQMDTVFMTRGILQASKQLTISEAVLTFDNILAKSPTNLIALHGKARMNYAKRNYREALQLFQQVLRLSPYSRPDPRIGIGLCLWQLGDKVKAKAAWERSLEVNPKNWPAELLLGIEALNASKDPKKTQHQRHEAYAIGSKHIERAFSMNQKNAATANCLSEYFIRRKQTGMALKLAERAIQFADTFAVLNEGHLRAGRVAHSEGRLDDALSHYSFAKALPLASLGIAQVHLQRDEAAAAIHVLDSLLSGSDAHKSPEAMVMLASIRGSHRPALSQVEYDADKNKARDMFERVKKELEHFAIVNGSTNGPLRTPRISLLDDLEMHLELARLWQSDNIPQALMAYQQARKIKEHGGNTDPKIINNIACLHHLEGNLDTARSLYEEALSIISQVDAGIGEASDGPSTTILYNLARVYEDQGDSLTAKEAYDKLLSRHPEYIDAKVRQAHILTSLNRFNEAHDIIKQALTTQKANMNLRAYYTHFLLQSGLTKPALPWVFSTLKEYNKSDTHANCAAAWLHYTLARESRDGSTEGIRDRRRKFTAAAEFYEKALTIDPACAFAAQGLAIIVAEDALGVMSVKTPGAVVDDENIRSKNTREALDVFAKVRETLADGSVYANMGHCYFTRDEYDRAIESYETASKRYYNGQNVPVLMCLARAWYAKAIRDQSFVSMQTALECAQQCQHITPMDKAIRYNVAIIQQKGAEMMFSLPLSKRTLEELHRGLEHAGHSQRLFASLADDSRSDVLPYSTDVAKQRQLYGASLLRKGADQITRQEAYDADQKAKINAAREVRMAEKAAAEALERERLEELQRKALELAEERRKARELAATWVSGMKTDSEDEEKPKKRKKEKSQGDENIDEAGDKKKKGRRKLRRSGSGPNAEEDEALFSGEEEEDRPKKRTSKRRVVDDEDDDGQKPSKKKFKSSEMIADSDEELERLDKLEEAEAEAKIRALSVDDPEPINGVLEEQVKPELIDVAMEE